MPKLLGRLQRARPYAHTLCAHPVHTPYARTMCATIRAGNRPTTVKKQIKSLPEALPDVNYAADDIHPYVYIYRFHTTWDKDRQTDQTRPDQARIGQDRTFGFYVKSLPWSRLPKVWIPKSRSKICVLWLFDWFLNFSYATADYPFLKNCVDFTRGSSLWRDHKGNQQICLFAIW